MLLFIGEFEARVLVVDSIPNMLKNLAFTCLDEDAFTSGCTWTVTGGDFIFENMS